MDAPMFPVLPDAALMPLLDEAGRAMLKRLTEHPHAPCFNFRTGDRLSAEGLASVRRFEAAFCAGPWTWEPGGVPDWLPGFAAHCLDQVPFYRQRGGNPGDRRSIPPCRRDDLALRPWSFVPDDVPLDDLITLPTSGAGGAPMSTPSTITAQAGFLPALRAALACHGATLDGGAGRVAIAWLGAHRRTLTYATVSSVLDQAGILKLTLNPAAWRDPDDLGLYLEDSAPAVLTGDPVAFQELARQVPGLRPKALVSTALALLPGLRDRLAAVFGCPVVDLYSMTECRAIAVAEGDGHRLLGPDRFVEILRPDGTPAAPGEHGEITVTSRRNPALPLLRYRTGDHARLAVRSEGVWLLDLQGRPPVHLIAADGRAVPSLDVATALRSFGLARYALHQAADKSLRLRTDPPLASDAAVRAALAGVLGAALPLTVDGLEAVEGKVMAFTSDLL